MSQSEMDRLRELSEADNITCFQCAYFHFSVPGATYGQCRADTPTANPETLKAQWPHVEKNDWCGNHEPVMEEFDVN